MADLKEAIRVGRELIDTTPLGHLGRAGSLNELRSHLGNRYSQIRVIPDLKEAIQVS